MILVILRFNNLNLILISKSIFKLGLIRIFMLFQKSFVALNSLEKSIRNEIMGLYDDNREIMAI